MAWPGIELANARFHLMVQAWSRSTSRPHRLDGDASRGDGEIVAAEAGNARERQRTMTDKPVELDEHRGMAAQKLTETRRRLREVQADQSALRHRQEEFERYAVAAPSASWSAVAERARYLIQLFAATPEAQDPRRQELIASVLDDLARFSNEPN